MFTTGFWAANLEGTVARMNACLLGWGPKADFPAAASYKGTLALATDEGGLVYYSDGTNWVSLGNLTTLAQTMTGLKTFGSIPVLPASDPTTDNEAARKAYVDKKGGILTWINVAGTTIAFATSRWFTLNSHAPPDATNTNTELLAPKAGTLKNLYVRVTANTLDAAITVVVQINAVSKTLTLSIAAGTTGTFSDVAHTDAVVAGNLITVTAQVAGTAGSITIKQVSLEFV